MTMWPISPVRFPVRTKGCLPVVLAFFTATATPSWGMDLLQSYRLALQEDASVRAARAAADSAREREPQAKAQLGSNVVFSAGRNFNDLTREYNGTQSPNEEYYSFNQTLQWRQPLYRKPLWDAWEQAIYVVQDANATLERELQNLSVRVAGAYLEALLAQDQLDLVLKQQSFIQTELDAAIKAMVAGSGIRTDIDEAQARLDMNVAQELEARQNLDYTQRQLEVLTKQTVVPLARLDPKRLQLLSPEPKTLGEWLLLAESNSPEIQSLKAKVEAAKLEVSKAQDGYLPTVDAVLQLTRSASENVTSPASSYTNRTLGLQVNVPLYTSGYTASVIRQALAEQTRVEESLEATRRDLGLRLHREFRGVTEGIAKVKAYEQAVVSGEQLVKSMRRSLQAGGRTMVDVMNAEQQLQTTLRDLAQARYMHLISLVRLQALAGLDKEQVLVQINGYLSADAQP